MNPSRRRLAAALIITVILAGTGCSGDGGDGVSDSTTTTKATTDRATSTAADVTTTTAASDQVPDPATRGEDFDKVFREILSFETWVFEHPDMKQLDVIYTGEANKSSTPSPSSRGSTR